MLLHLMLTASFNQLPVQRRIGLSASISFDQADYFQVPNRSEGGNQYVYERGRFKVTSLGGLYLIFKQVRLRIRQIIYWQVALIRILQVEFLNPKTVFQPINLYLLGYLLRFHKQIIINKSFYSISIFSKDDCNLYYSLVLHSFNFEKFRLIESFLELKILQILSNM